jgi:superfamily II DNA/RNA helicase
MEFSNVKSLPPQLLTALTLLGFTHQTPVQSSVIPLFITGHKDVIVQAVTGFYC